MERRHSGASPRHGTMKQLLLALFVLVLLPVFQANAQQPRSPIDISALGPQVGEIVPDFSLPDQDGRVWTRDSIMGPNGALLLFHRSADW